MKIQVLEFNIGELQQGRYPFQFQETCEHVAANLKHAATGRASSWNIILLIAEDTPERLKLQLVAQRKISVLESAIKSGALTSLGNAQAQDLLKQNWAEVEEYDSIHG